MEKKTIKEIQQIYELELNKLISKIKKEKARKVLLQFPEGMKPYSTEICAYIEQKTSCEGFIWLDTCFGACDIPLEVEKLGVDLIIQFGHTAWDYNREDINVL